MIFYPKIVRIDKNHENSTPFSAIYQVLVVKIVLRIVINADAKIVQLDLYAPFRANLYALRRREAALVLSCTFKKKNEKKCAELCKRS